MSTRGPRPEGTGVEPLRTRDAEVATGPPWWLGLLVGGSVFAFGLVGLLHNDGATRPGDWVKWVLGSVIAHDAILAPAVLVAGFLLTRLLPVPIRGGLQATLAVCGAVALMSVPVVMAEGRRADNPSLLPHDYGENLAVVLAVILAGGVLLTLVRAARRSRRGSAG